MPIEHAMADPRVVTCRAGEDGVPGGAGPFASHGHTLRLTVLPPEAASEPPPDEAPPSGT